MITENLSTLKIHKLTRAQYERELAAGRLDPNAIYLTPDDTNSDPSAVVTVDPTLSVSGQAADAKVVGDALAEKQPIGDYALKSDIPSIPVTSVNGQTGDVIIDAASGKDGYTPIRGTDYWTEADKAEIKSYVDEAILGGAW